MTFSKQFRDNLSHLSPAAFLCNYTLMIPSCTKEARKCEILNVDVRYYLNILKY